MAYSRNKYKLMILKNLPKDSKLINRDFYKSLKEFLKENGEILGIVLNQLFSVEKSFLLLLWSPANSKKFFH